MRISARKIVLLLSVMLAFLATTAYADGNNFSITITDVQSGATVTINDNPALVASGGVFYDPTCGGNGSGGFGGTAASCQVQVDPVIGGVANPGVITFNGYVGNYKTAMSLAFTDTPNTNSANTNYGGLQLNGTFGSTTNGPGQLLITVQDSFYGQPVPGSTATFSGTVGGNSYGDGGQYAPTNGSVALQGWINTSNQDFATGAAGYYPANSTTPPGPSAPVLSVPVGSLSVFNGGTQSSAGEAFSGTAIADAEQGTVQLDPSSAGYAMMMQATVNFAGGASATNQADFGVALQTSSGACTGNCEALISAQAPEPTSLLLLGSGLVGLGLLRRKHGRTS